MPRPPQRSVPALRLHRRLRTLTAARRRLTRRLEAQGRLVALVSHELREPLAALLGQLRELAEEEADAARRERLALCLQAAETLTGLVNDLIDGARAEAGRLRCRPRPFRLDGFLRRLVALVEPRARARGLSFELALDPTLPPVVRGDPGRLRQVLLNLLTNAVKYTERGGVRLLVDRREGGLAFTVEDSGRGLPPALRARMTAFCRGREDELIPGAGLGLYIARRLTALMGARLVLEDRPEGGTRAVLEVPLDEDAAPPEEAATPHGLRALVVGLVPAAAEVVGRALTAAGLQVATAPSLAAARAQAEEAADGGSPPELVAVTAAALDQPLLDFARRLRRHPGLAETRLLLQVTGGLRGDAALAERAGFDAYLAGNPQHLPWPALLARLAPGRPERLLVAHDVAEGPQRPLRVLVVEDDPLNARLLALLLERLGHRPVRVASGEAALARLVADSAFDVVLLDLQLPGMDGLEFVRRLRQLPQPWAAALPVVAVTAAVLPEDRRRCLAAGMAGFVEKPVERAALAAALARAVAA